VKRASYEAPLLQPPATSSVSDTHTALSSLSVCSFLSVRGTGPDNIRIKEIIRPI